ncbi:MAG: hypothetical protein MK210_19220, partial [Dehalococcoidia bacterium]|nr:hypothetical protein [Dehalococcoidia bacterium]
GAHAPAAPSKADMAWDLVLGLEPKPEFLPLFNLGEPITTGDSELVTGALEWLEIHQPVNLMAVLHGW